MAEGDLHQKIQSEVGGLAKQVGETGLDDGNSTTVESIHKPTALESEQVEVRDVSVLVKDPLWEKLYGRVVEVGGASFVDGLRLTLDEWLPRTVNENLRSPGVGDDSKVATTTGTRQEMDPRAKDGRSAQGAEPGPSESAWERATRTRIANQ